MNALETKMSDSLTKGGWTVLKQGWPDFLIYREGVGRIHVAGVEVKSASDKLSEQQELMHRVLRAVGLPVHTVRPDFLNKCRIGKTRATLTAAEKLDVQSQVSKLKAELAELQERLQETESVLEKTSMVFDPGSTREVVLGNGGITQPTEAQAMSNAFIQMDARLGKSAQADRKVA
jgi:VRR-NUC domain